MDTATRHERKRLLKQIDWLEKQRCYICKDTPSTQKMVHCDCEAAVEIRKLGEKLIKTVTKRRNEELDAVVAKVTQTTLTVESYHEFKALNKSDREISKMLGWYYGKMVDFKYDNGLSKRKGPSQIELTEEEKATAKENGLSLSTVRKRIRVDGWEVARAITESPNSHKQEFAKWADIAAENGVPRNTFSTRLRNGLSFQEAATFKKGEHRVSKAEKHNLSNEMVELAEKNGIVFSTFKKRVKELGWSQERAATEPPQNRKVGVTQ